MTQSYDWNQHRAQHSRHDSTTSVWQIMAHSLDSANMKATVKMADKYAVDLQRDMMPSAIALIASSSTSDEGLCERYRRQTTIKCPCVCKTVYLVHGAMSLWFKANSSTADTSSVRVALCQPLPFSHSTVRVSCNFVSSSLHIVLFFPIPFQKIADQYRTSNSIVFYEILFK